MQPARVSETTSVLGKRKSRAAPESYVLHLASSPEPSTASEYESELAHVTPSSTLPVIVNGKLVFEKQTKNYCCQYPGCIKAYSKPSRLVEHERSHSGERPFVCTTCNKSYLRESHLQAHARSHLPASSRPLACLESGCDKRFWTSQHLRAHIDWHKGKKAFSCPEEDCHEAFAKHTQLKAHIATIHSPPGTKPFQCTHNGCSKTFATNQHLKAHLKTHDEKRYTCSHGACLPRSGEEPQYFSKWTALQHHIRTTHPPTCPHTECHDKSFSCRENLRAHLKLHDQREVEDKLRMAEGNSDDEDAPPAKRRRGGEVGRDWVCTMEDCSKDFKSQKALNTHVKVSHLGQRSHVCPHEDCRRAFGYKHLLQRHLAKAHVSTSEEEDETSGNETDPTIRPTTSAFRITDITGQAYSVRAQDKLRAMQSVACPFPDLSTFGIQGASAAAEPSSCDFVFSRAYDLRRHLRAVHEVDVAKKELDTWVKGKKSLS